MAKVRITAIYEYEIHPGHYPKEYNTDEKRMELDKTNVNKEGFLLDEMSELKNTKWEIIK
jgi:hypothetical protein